jgi:polyphenol oxidase
MLLRSRTLDSISHGFPVRTGGVSQGSYASLNLSAKWGDDASHVAENRRRLAEAGGFSLPRLYTARQVHGVEVIVVRGDEEPSLIATREADALVTEQAGVTLGISTADCVPILIADGRGRVAAIHAGWRGTVADVAARAVDALVALGARREDLRAALGPSICLRCFEVGEEVAAHFAKLGVVDATFAKPHVDLRRANRVLLERAGVRKDAIDGAPPCTMCEPERFFSFRRDGAGIGQHLSFITGGITGDGAA